MTQPSENKEPVIVVPRHRWDAPIRVRLKHYLQFSRRIDAGLRELVDRWSRKSLGDASRMVSVRRSVTPNKPR